MTTITLFAGGPHSDAYTVKVAQALSECVRVLNHSTLPGTGVTTPDTVSQVSGNVRDTFGRLDQLLTQLGSRLFDMEATGRVYDERDRGNAVLASQTIGEVVDDFASAIHGLVALTYSRARAASAAARLGMHPDPDDAGEG